MLMLSALQVPTEHVIALCHPYHTHKLSLTLDRVQEEQVPESESKNQFSEWI